MACMRLLTPATKESYVGLFIVYVPNTTWMRVFNTERRALASRETAAREGMDAMILKVELNKDEYDES
jgi:hypothetical protein